MEASAKATEAEAKKTQVNNEKKKMGMSIMTMDMSALSPKTRKWFKRMKEELLDE